MSSPFKIALSVRGQDDGGDVSDTIATGIQCSGRLNYGSEAPKIVSLSRATRSCQRCLNTLPQIPVIYPTRQIFLIAAKGMDNGAVTG